MFFLVTGDRRRALRTQVLDDDAWTAALRSIVQSRDPGDLSRSGTVRGDWMSGNAPGSRAGSADWIQAALTEMDAEHRACVILPALLEKGDDALAAFLVCTPIEAVARHQQAMNRLRLRMAEADTDRSEARAPRLSYTALSEALTEIADDGLFATVEPIPKRKAGAWLRRAVLLAIAALVVITGLTRIAVGPPAATWQEFGAIAFSDGRLRRLGRGSVSEALWSPNGSRIVLAATTGVYAVDSANLRLIAHAHTEPGTQLLGFNSEGNQIATWLDGVLTLRDVVDLRPAYTVTALAWHNATAAAWDWANATLALGWEEGVVLVRPRSAANQTWFPAASGVTHLRFSPDGSWLAITTALPETLVVRTDGTRLFKIHSSAYPPSATAFSDDGRRLIGVFGQGLDVADINAGNWTTAVSRSGLKPALWLSPDGRRAIVVTTAIADEAELLTFNLDTGQVLRQFRVPGNRDVAAFTVRRDGERALIFNADGLSIWDLNTGALVAASVDFAPPHGAGGPTPVRFSEDGRLLLAPDAYGGLRILDAASGRTERALNDNADPFVDAVFSPDGQRIVADNNAGVGLRPLASGDRTRQHEPALYVLDVGSGRTTHVFPGARHPQFIGSSVVAYVPIERGELRSYNFLTGANQAWAGVRATRLDAFVASVNATRVAVLTDRTLELWDAGAGLQWRVPLARTDVNRGLLGRPLAMSGDGLQIAVAEPSLGIRVYSGGTGVLRGTLAQPITVTFEASLANPLTVAISRDGRWLGTVDNRPTPMNTPSSTLTLWRADTLRAIAIRSDFPNRVAGIDFSPDSRRVAIIRADYVVELIDLP